MVTCVYDCRVESTYKPASLITRGIFILRLGRCRKTPFSSIRCCTEGHQSRDVQWKLSVFYYCKINGSSSEFTMSKPSLFPLLKFLYFPPAHAVFRKASAGKVSPKSSLQNLTSSQRAVVLHEVTHLDFTENQCPYLAMLGMESVSFTLLHRIFI